MLVKDLCLNVAKRSFRSGLSICDIHSRLSTWVGTTPKLPKSSTRVASLLTHTSYSDGSTSRLDPGCIYQQYRLKGHAHWQNVASDKKEGGARKGAVKNMYHVKIYNVMRAGGTDPKTNKELASVMQECIKNNVPKANVEGWIAKFNEVKSAGHGHMEINGLNGIIFVIRTEFNTDKIFNNIRTMAKKLPVTVPKQARWTRLFDQKGVIIVPVREGMDVTNMDPYIEIALESGAEDVIVTKSEGDEPGVESVLKFHCEPEWLDRVAQEIQITHNLEISYQDVDITPHNFITLETKEDLAFYQNLIDKMYSHEDVIGVFHNIALPEE